MGKVSTILLVKKVTTNLYSLIEFVTASHRHFGCFRPARNTFKYETVTINQVEHQECAQCDIGKDGGPVGAASNSSLTTMSATGEGRSQRQT